MDIRTLQVGQMDTNCYLITDPNTTQTLILDPGDEADFISTTIIEQRLTPVLIVLTHGHFDHCLASLELKLNFNLPIYLHKADLFLYQKAHLSSAHFQGTNSPHLPKVDHYLINNDTLNFGDTRLTVIHTPGHTPGSICLVQNNSQNPSLFTGDTLFADGIGRTDLSYSSSVDLQKSLTKLSKLPQNTTVYPGHGSSCHIRSYRV